MDYEIIRSRRKTACIEVKSDGRVLVRVPNRMSQKAVETFVDSKKEWILKAKKKLLEKSAMSLDEEVEKLTDSDIKRLTNKARLYIKARCDLYAQILDVSYNRISIRQQQTRWGSCSTKGNLNFNVLLMMAPIEVIDYVVVHELCHRVHMNHSKDFWNLVESVMPDYKVHRKWLSDNGNRLMMMLPDKKEEKSKHFTYILRCSDGTYYTGYTNNLEKRILAHNTGKGAKYTKRRLPVELVYYEEYNSKEEAMRREALIKQLTKRQKEALIKK